MRLRWVPAVALLLSACTSSPDAEPVERTTVPRIEYGTSVDDAMRVLEEAGLRGTEPEVDWPHYVIGTDPEAGTSVPVGSEVRLEIGDG